jgi:cytochrome c-L
MAFVRHVYWGDPQKADWLTEEEKETYESAPVPEEFKEAMENFKKTHPDE